MSLKLLFIGGFTLAWLLTGTPSPAGIDHKSATSQKQDDCDGPDADVTCCFVNVPSGLNHIMNIAGPAEKGERLVISGTVFKADGKTPAPGVLMYAYQTDNTGHYSKKGNEKGIQKWHGHLHGWCKTNSRGYYEIRSIRTARYP